ncbi:hypothetical protein F8M41_004304 [Gigaspora margarita]|uniref:Uncharacterized protein n=1 Tax=Gigaspora margarita TaxID=4874 RepID=A0A8H4AXT0_GIGMA|nr:hypothetical protein F8M41_004304 [Gigaspora margarita]
MCKAEQICFDNFRHYGILLPYGALNAHHNTQNRFIVDPTCSCVMTVSLDLLSGWDIFKIVQVRHRTADEDFYRKLFFYLHKQFEMFIDRLQKLTINFDLYNEDALKLNKKLNDKRFDRIYINNLGDESYVGIKSILTKLRLLLNANNQHATLITLFMNWLLSVPQSDQEEIMESILKNNSKYYSKWKQKFTLIM